MSGVSTRLADRPEGRRLFDMLRAGDTLVVRWVDRLGRNYRDVTDTIREFMRRGVVIRTVINGMVFDGATKDPMQQAVRDALIAFMAATAQAQAEATKEAQRAGILHAQENDDGTKFRGRKPSFDWPTFAAVQELLSQGIAVAEIAKTTGLKRQTIYRIQKEPERQATALAAWESKPGHRPRECDAERGGFPQSLFASSFPRGFGSTWGGSCCQHPDVSAGWPAGFSGS